jgi:hypothetical protein
MSFPRKRESIFSFIQNSTFNIIKFHYSSALHNTRSCNNLQKQHPLPHASPPNIETAILVTNPEMSTHNFTPEKQIRRLGQLVAHTDISPPPTSPMR